MSMSDPLIGQRLGDYLIEGLLGTGGMARVYRGYDENLDRYAAVKVIEPQLIASADEEEYRERFLREARAIARLSHPRIVSVYQFNQIANLYYIAMEYVEGPNLRDVLKGHLQDDELMPTDAMMTILEDIADALDYAHKNDIIHRDVKPSNIIVTNEGNAVLTDFGLALNAVEGTVGNTFGSVHYIAPEQAISSAQAVPQSDQYSLGIVAYEIITGRVPFDDDSAMSVALKHISDPPPPPTDLNPNVPPEVEQVVLRALDKEVHGRYDTARDFVKALEMAFDMLENENIAPPPEMPTGKLAPSDTDNNLPPVSAADESPTVKDSKPSLKSKSRPAKPSSPSIEGKTQSQPLPENKSKKKKEPTSTSNWGRWVAVAAVLGVLMLGGGFVVYDNYSQSVNATSTAVAQVATDSAVATNLAETASFRETEAFQTQQSQTQESQTQTAEANAAATETANADATDTAQANLDATNTAEADVSSTPTPTPTLAATATLTPSPTASPTATETPLPTNTPPPTASPTPSLFVDDPTAAGAAQIILRYDGRLLVLGNRSDSETYNLSDIRFLLFAPDDNGEIRRATSYAIGDSDTLQSAARNFNPERCLQMLDNTRFSGLPPSNEFADELCAGTPFWATTGNTFWAHPNVDEAYFEVRLGAVDVLATCPVNVPGSRSELRCAVNLAP